MNSLIKDVPLNLPSRYIATVISISISCGPGIGFRKAKTAWFINGVFSSKFHREAAETPGGDRTCLIRKLKWASAPKGPETQIKDDLEASRSF